MEFPIGFPARLKPRLEAAVLKACRQFPELEQMPKRVAVGMDAFAKIALEAATNEEWDLESAHRGFEEFLHILCVQEFQPDFAVIRSVYERMVYATKMQITHSDQWIRWMETLDAIGRKRTRQTPQGQSVNAHVTIERQLEALRSECRWTVEELAEGMTISLRSVQRHLSGEAVPRKRHIAEYEKRFSAKLNRDVRLTNVT
jgi:hypothetical protein